MVRGKKIDYELDDFQNLEDINVKSLIKIKLFLDEVIDELEEDNTL